MLEFIRALRPKVTEPERILEHFKQEGATSLSRVDTLARVAREDWETYESTAFPKLKAEDRTSWMALATALKKKYLSE
jgi:hypothetical protein